MRRNIGSLLDRHFHASPLLLGSLRKPRRQWQRERHLTKGFNEHNNVCARALLIVSLRPRQNKQREMTKICVVWRTYTVMANFFKFIFLI